MALTYTLYTKGQASGVGDTITSNTLTVAAGDFITVVAAYPDNSEATAWAVTNTGTAITWTQQDETNVASQSKTVFWTGTAGATPPTTISVQSTAGGAINGSKFLFVVPHTGAHATTPLPAGNVFSGAGGLTDVSQAITPTSSGSCLWMVCADWLQTNSYAAIANCTLGTVYDEAGQFTAVAIRPTTQPRTDASAFTIGETDTAGRITYVAFEVQAEASASTTKQLMTLGVG